MKRRITAVLLCLMLVFSCISCGGGAKTAGAGTETTDSGADTAGGSAEAADSGEETAADAVNNSPDTAENTAAGTASEPAADPLEALAWWQKTTAYEIYVNSFKDSDGDGYGDINGIRSELDHLVSLGVGALWLTPVFESPMVDNGYDVSDYRKINPRYGTMEDMDQLIAEADEKGIRIVMDLVYNHTSDQNPWFVESSKDKVNPYEDWYIWRDPAPDGGEPNNWRGIFGGSAWTWCEQRGQYYLHTFAKEQPDLNWENPDVRNALYEITNFWIDKGVGGFRIDAITYIKKPADFSDGPADDSEGRSDIHALTANSPGILDFLKEFREQTVAGTDVFTIGEANGVPAEQLDQWVGKQGVFDMIFSFAHVSVDQSPSNMWCRPREWVLTDVKQALSDVQESSADGGWCPVYFENHDHPRSVDRYFDAQADKTKAAKALGAVLMTLRGTPFIYQGEELGMTNVSWDSIEMYDDLNSGNQFEIALNEGFSESEALEFVHRFSRDNSRTPMQWDDSENAGFTTGKPWLPVNENYRSINVKTESADPASVLSWYRELASLRKDHPALIDGSYEELLKDSEQVYAYTRTDHSEKLLILVNFSGDEVRSDLNALGPVDAGSAKLLKSSIDESSFSIGVLRPYEAVILSY